MIFVGIDPSIVCTGIVAIMDGAVVWERTVEEPKRKKGEPARGYRIDPPRLAKQVLNIEDMLGVRALWPLAFGTYEAISNGMPHCVIAIEEPFIGKNATTALKTYSVFSALVFDLQLKVVDGKDLAALYTPSPQTIKKFVGAKEKNFVARAVFRKWGYAADDDNLVDAYAIARWAEATWAEQQK